MSRNKARAVLVAALLVMSAVSVVPAAIAAGTSAAAAASPHEDGAPINYTVALSTHKPGASEVTISQFAAGQPQAESVVTLKYWGFLTSVSPAELKSTCQTADARAAGVDRDNDNAGTYTDESFIGKYSKEIQYKNSQGQNITTYDFYEPNSFEGQSIYFNSDDQIVAQLANCYTNPQSPGWYRFWGHINGTRDGKTYQQTSKYRETNSYSHWWYICDCESYDAAVNKIGQPPQDAKFRIEEDGKYGTRAGGNGPWKLYAKPGSGGGSGDGTPTSTDTGTSTSTDTSTSTSTDTGTSTNTGTTTSGTTSPPQNQNNQNNQNSPSPGSTATTVTTNPGQSTNTGGGGGGGGNNVSTATQTSTHQPGFGLGLALVALAAAALVAYRRD